MNAVLVILLTGLAVLGAYFLADLLSGTGKEKYIGNALVVLCEPATACEAVQLAISLREIMPQCEVLCAPASEEEQLPTQGCGYQGITFVPQDHLIQEAARRLHLQTDGNPL